MEELPKRHDRRHTKRAGGQVLVDSFPVFPSVQMMANLKIVDVASIQHQTVAYDDARIIR